MKLHHYIFHHVRKHKEKVIAHVKKHQKKYILGAGVTSGILIVKIFGLLLMFLGISQTGTTGAEYYYFDNAHLSGNTATDTAAGQTEKL